MRVGTRVRIRSMPAGQPKQYLQGQIGTVTAYYSDEHTTWAEPRPVVDVLIDGQVIPVCYFVAVVERL